MFKIVQNPPSIASDQVYLKDLQDTDVLGHIVERIISGTKSTLICVHSGSVAWVDSRLSSTAPILYSNWYNAINAAVTAGYTVWLHSGIPNVRSRKVCKNPVSCDDQDIEISNITDAMLYGKIVMAEYGIRQDLLVCVQGGWQWSSMYARSVQRSVYKSLSAAVASRLDKGMVVYVFQSRGELRDYIKYNGASLKE